MLNLVHKIVSTPFFYDISQKLAGGPITQSILRKELLSRAQQGAALDVGGGTGLMRPLLPKSWNYTCLDNDKKKLDGFEKKFPKDKTIEASATNIPEPDNAYDLCILSAVSHHLQNSDLEKVLAEISRVLRPNGELLFLDALLNKKNLAGRFLWAVDRGRFPRSLGELKIQIEKKFSIRHSEFWKVLHEYALFLCNKKP